MGLKYLRHVKEMALVVEHIVPAFVFFEYVESALFLIYSHYYVDEIKLLVCERG